MNYRELQKQLKVYKSQGVTKIRLNSKKVVLQKEYNRIISEKQGTYTINYPNPHYYNIVMNTSKNEIFSHGGYIKQLGGKTIVEHTIEVVKSNQESWVEEIERSNNSIQVAWCEMQVKIGQRMLDALGVSTHSEPKTVSK